MKKKRILKGKLFQENEWKAQLNFQWQRVYQKHLLLRLASSHLT